MKPLRIMSRWLVVLAVFALPWVGPNALHAAEILMHLQAPAYQVVEDSVGTQRVDADGFQRSGSPGAPSLPRRIYSVAVPPDTDPRSLSVDVITEKIADLPGAYDLTPARPPATWAGGERIVSWDDDSGSIVNGKATAVYGHDAYVPSTAATLVRFSQMRKWRFIDVAYTPFQYNPVTRRLRVVAEADIRIGFDRTPALNGGLSDTMADSGLDDRAREILFNYDQARAWYRSETAQAAAGLRNGYVIITTNEILSRSVGLQNFVLHKEGRGYAVEVVTEDQYGDFSGQAPNGTAEKIRQWLIENHVGTNIEYVLLIGNPDPDDPADPSDSAGDVPMKMCWPRRGESRFPDVVEAPTDYFYADLTGDWDLDGDGFFGEHGDDDEPGGVDFAPEVYVGRIPVYTGLSGWVGRLDSILQKTMDYEGASDTAWRSSALLPMSFSDADTDGAFLAEAMEDDYLMDAGFFVRTAYQHKTTGCDSGFQSDDNLLHQVVRDRWQANPFGLMAWWAHGSRDTAFVGYDPGCGDGTLLSSRDASALDDPHPAVVFQISCDNGTPEYPENLGYALLKQGAVATVSSSRESWYFVGSWDPDQGHEDGAALAFLMARNLITGQTVGRALFDPKSAGGSLPEEWMNVMVFNIYGDPSVRMFCPTPGAVDPLSPEEGATTPPNVRLAWSESPEAVSYDVYFGNATAPEVLVASGLDALEFRATAPGPGVYFWKVVANNACGVAESPTRSFTVAAEGVFRYESRESISLGRPESLFTSEALPWTDPDEVLDPDRLPLLFYNTAFPGVRIAVGKQGVTVRVEELP